MTPAEPVGVGQRAPEFELRDQHGQTVRLSALRGRPVALMFYPWAFSRVCTGEFRSLRDEHPALRGPEVALFGVSCDPVFSLRAYAESERLDVRLLSDFWPHGAVAASYGVLDEERGCARRSTFVLDRQGVVRWSVHSPTPDARDLSELERALAALSGPG